MKVYIDSNVPAYAGGAGDATPPMRRASRRLLRLARRRRIEAVTSLVTILDLERTPARKTRRRSLRWLTTGRVKTLPEDAAGEAVDLAQKYLGAGVVPPKKLFDALHLAWGSLAGAEVFVSRNRADLVRLKTRTLVNTINRQMGLLPLAVELPDEVLREIEGH